MVLCDSAAWNVLCLPSFPSVLQPDCPSLVFPTSQDGRRWGGLSTNIFTCNSCTSVTLLWQSNSTGIKDPTCCQMPEELSSIFMSVTVQWRCFSLWFLGAKVDCRYIIYRVLLDKRPVFRHAWKSSEEERGLESAWIQRKSCEAQLALPAPEGSVPGSARTGSGDQACSGWLLVWPTAGSIVHVETPPRLTDLVLEWLSICKPSLNCTLNAPREVTKTAVD